LYTVDSEGDFVFTKGEKHEIKRQKAYAF